MSAKNLKKNKELWKAIFIFLFIFIFDQNKVSFIDLLINLFFLFRFFFAFILLSLYIYFLSLYRWILCYVSILVAISSTRHNPIKKNTAYDDEVNLKNSQ